MGYSSRYHVASLAAVFIALAIGILIGAALGSDVVSGTAENLEEDLREDLDQVRAENADLSEEVAFEQEFAAQIAPAVVADRLAAREIALIGLGDIDTATLSADIEDALAPAGAELTEVASVREPPDASALTEQLLAPRERRRLGDDENLAAAAARAGRSLAGGGELPAETRSALLSEFSGSAESLDGVVIARSQPDDLTSREAGEVERLEAGLVSGLREAGVRVVGAERTDAEPSSIAAFDELGLASVDNIDQLAGKVALVLALDGADGNFGVKETAGSLLPDLIEPAQGG